MHYSSPTRALYSSKKAAAAAAAAAGTKSTGTPMRELHHAVYDAIAGRSGREAYVGRGSWAYEVVGRWVPGGVVGWMMRMRQRRADQQIGGDLSPAWDGKKEEEGGYGYGYGSGSGSEWEPLGDSAEVQV